MFPSPKQANKDGLLCYGGNLQADTLRSAYQQAIFPFYSEGQAILWWSPDPRMVLFPDHFYCSRRLTRRLRQACYRFTHNADFSAVIHACAEPRGGEDHNPWLLPDMIAAYIHLHQLGDAHSFEVWQGDDLIGGLYGVLQSQVFFAESMFSRQRDGSKMAMHTMVTHAKSSRWKLIDCQFYTEHLASMGAQQISRDMLLSYLES
ncbi:MAG: leucyl/phenylalanyl-tRNA--protein transferase [Mariprofundaceae bacterium]|nr:leucyl/phenylalanyl-tRNA--protein transferase [Mariprofundaceae bacterium]